MAAGDGIRNIVRRVPGRCPADGRVEGEPRRLGEFYAAVPGWVGTGLGDVHHQAFADGWTDHGHPVPEHLDRQVPDMASAVEWGVETGASIVGHPVVSGTAVQLPQLSPGSCSTARRAAPARWPPSTKGCWDRSRVDGFMPTTWPDPAVPGQIHLDLHFADGDAAVARADALGAPRPPRPARRQGGW